MAALANLWFGAVHLARYEEVGFFTAGGVALGKYNVSLGSCCLGSR